MVRGTEQLAGLCPARFNAIDTPPILANAEHAMPQDGLPAFAQLDVLVAYLTAPASVNDEILSDFLMTFRHFARPADVWRLLASRLLWAADVAARTGAESEHGKDVGTRCFVLMRQWVRDYFDADFAPDAGLRRLVADTVTALAGCSEFVLVDHFHRILHQLRAAWDAGIARYWPVAPGVLGNVDEPVPMGGDAPLADASFTGLPPQGASPLGAPRARAPSALLAGQIPIDADIAVTSIYSSPSRRKPRAKISLLFQRALRGTPAANPADRARPGKDGPSDVVLHDRVDLLAMQIIDEYHVRERQYLLPRSATASVDSASPDAGSPTDAAAAGLPRPSDGVLPLDGLPYSASDGVLPSDGLPHRGSDGKLPSDGLPHSASEGLPHSASEGLFSRLAGSSVLSKELSRQMSGELIRQMSMSCLDLTAADGPVVTRRSYPDALRPVSDRPAFNSAETAPAAGPGQQSESARGDPELDRVDREMSRADRETSANRTHGTPRETGGALPSTDGAQYDTNRRHSDIASGMARETESDGDQATDSDRNTETSEDRDIESNAGREIENVPPHAVPIDGTAAESNISTSMSGSLSTGVSTSNISIHGMSTHGPPVASGHGMHAYSTHSLNNSTSSLNTNSVDCSMNGTAVDAGTSGNVSSNGSSRHASDMYANSTHANSAHANSTHTNNTHASATSAAAVATPQDEKDEDDIWATPRRSPIAEWSLSDGDGHSRSQSTGNTLSMAHEKSVDTLNLNGMGLANISGESEPELSAEPAHPTDQPHRLIRSREVNSFDVLDFNDFETHSYYGSSLSTLSTSTRSAFSYHGGRPGRGRDSFFAARHADQGMRDSSFPDGSFRNSSFQDRSFHESSFHESSFHDSSFHGKGLRDKSLHDKSLHDSGFLDMSVHDMSVPDQASPTAEQDLRGESTDSSHSKPTTNPSSYDRPRSDGSISLISEFDNSKMVPCAGYTDSDAAILKAMPDDTVTGDVLLATLLKLEGKHTSASASTNALVDAMRAAAHPNSSGPATSAGPANPGNPNPTTTIPRSSTIELYSQALDPSDRPSPSHRRARQQQLDHEISQLGIALNEGPPPHGFVDDLGYDHYTHHYTTPGHPPPAPAHDHLHTPKPRRGGNHGLASPFQSRSTSRHVGPQPDVPRPLPTLHIGLPGASHAPFVLAYSARAIAEQMTLIEREVAQQIDWNSLLRMEGTRPAQATKSWLQVMMDESPPQGTALVQARFDLVYKWAQSEVLLCPNPGLQAQAISRFIGIAFESLRLQNFATMVQLVLALCSPEVQACMDGLVLQLLPQHDRENLERLESLSSPHHNYAKLRRAHNRYAWAKGCVPFTNMFLQDIELTTKAQSFNAEHEVHFGKYRVCAHLVKALRRCVESTANYTFALDPALFSKCLYLSSLPELSD